MKLEESQAIQISSSISRYFSDSCVVCPRKFNVIYALDGDTTNLLYENLIPLCQGHYLEAERTKNQPGTGATLSTQALKKYQHRAFKKQSGSRTTTISNIKDATVIIGERDAININIDYGTSPMPTPIPYPFPEHSTEHKAVHDRQFDAFISYSHQDGIWVQDILYPFLIAKNLKICLDIHHFNPGGYIINEIEFAVENSQKTILVFSPAYFDSEWTEVENILSNSLDPAARKRKIIPLLYKPCNLPLRFRSMIYIDFTQNQSSPPFGKLVKAIIS